MLLLKAYVVLISPRRLGLRDISELVVARWHSLHILHIVSRNGEVAARGGSFELANEKLMHKFVTGAVAGAVRPPDTAEMNLNFLIICRDNVPNMSPEARIDLVCPVLANKLTHFLIYEYCCYINVV